MTTIGILSLCILLVSLQIKAQDQINVLELRNYLLQDEAREEFITHFEKHFIDSQNQLGAFVLGQFRLKDEPNRFVWIRGFTNMASRNKALIDFYLQSSAWKKYGPKANSLMLEFDQVLLLRPVAGIENHIGQYHIDQFRHDPSAPEQDPSAPEQDRGVMCIKSYQAKAGQMQKLLTLYQQQMIPALKEAGVKIVGVFVCEMAENDFPRLPVIQDKDILTVFLFFDNQKQHRMQQEWIELHHLSALQALEQISLSTESLLLYPTLHSTMQKSTVR